MLISIGGLAERRLTRFAHVISAPPVDIREYRRPAAAGATVDISEYPRAAERAAERCLLTGPRGLAG